ncbi:MAG: hypothetical protein L3K26_06810 [Candidatus Hydrogenedentes bacterium]|nr:hypothetical protein [Candidatus Hydrogenedentota bacterium]
MPTRIAFVIIALMLVALGCDTLNPTMRLSPVGASTDSARPNAEPHLVSNTELISEELPALDERLLLGKRFDVYKAGEFFVQPVGGLWSDNALGISILVKNTGTVPWDIPLDRSTFVPKDMHRAWHKEGMEFDPFIAFIDFGADGISILAVPEDVSPQIAFMPSVKSRWSNVHDALESRMQSYYKDFEGHVVKGMLSSVIVPPGESAFIFLVFPVGFIERGEFVFPVDRKREVRIEFSE